MQSMFDFDLNLPPSEDVAARDTSPPPLESKVDRWAPGESPPPSSKVERDAWLPPPPEDDGMDDASPEMLDLHVSDDDDDDDQEGEEGEIELQPYASHAPTRSPEKTARSSSSPACHAAEVPVAPPIVQAGVDTARSSCTDVHGSTAPFSPSRHGGRTSWPNSETDLPPPPPPPPPPAHLTFPARSSSGSSPSRAHGNGRTSDTSSSPWDRRLFPCRDGDHGNDGLFAVSKRRSPAAYPRHHRRHDGGRRSHHHGEQAMRGQQQEAPPLRYAPYNENHHQRGHRGNERPRPRAQGYRVHQGDRGYETPNFRAQQQQQGYSSSSSNQFAGQRGREDGPSYNAGRQVPAQQVQNGGYQVENGGCRRHQYNREPPRGRGHFPAAAQPRRHPYAREAGEVGGANDGNYQASRHQQARREYVANPNRNQNQQRSNNGQQRSTRRTQAAAGPVRARQYYGDLYDSQSPSRNP